MVPRFVWSDEKSMHVSLPTTTREAKIADGYREMQTLATAVWGDDLLEYEEAWTKIQSKQKSSEPDAKRTFTRINSFGLIEQITKRKGAALEAKEVLILKADRIKAIITGLSLDTIFCA
jgi:hypothetical protein